MILFKTSHDFDKSLISSFNHFDINQIIVCSTRHIEEDWLFFLNKIAPTTLFDHKIELPIINLYETPLTLGKDRLASAVASESLFPHSNKIIINAGTCITVDFVDEKAQYHGGNILPGMQMRLKAMHEFTAKLPLVKVEYNNAIFGKNTEDALQNGGVKGAIYEVSAFVSEVNAHYPKNNVILSGGDSHLFAKHLKFKIFAVPNLVLRGLNETLKYNT
jgi:type III pantothenate kinase